MYIRIGKWNQNKRGLWKTRFDKTNLELTVTQKTNISGQYY